MQKFETLRQPLLWFWIAVVQKEERGYIPGRAQLYCRKSAVIFPEERGYIFVMKIVATFVSACSQAQRMHSAWTNNINTITIDISEGQKDGVKNGHPDWQ